MVYCGNAGLLPVDKVDKQPKAGDWIVAIGGRTGRDGIHGATFSSVELTSESESISGGSVQIGNAITEKMVLDVLLQAEPHHGGSGCGQALPKTIHNKSHQKEASLPDKRLISGRQIRDRTGELKHAHHYRHCPQR